MTNASMKSGRLSKTPSIELTLDTPTTFMEYFGSIPTLKTLDFLMENERTCWSIVEISRQGRVAYPSLKIVMPQLLARDLVIIERRVGRSALYRINKQNAIVKRLMELQLMTADAEMSRELRLKVTH